VSRVSTWSGRTAERGLAHDLRNLLTAITGHAELVRDALPEGDPARDDLDQVLAAASRAHELAATWLDGAGSGAPTGPPTPLDELVRGFLPLLSAIAGPRIRVELALEAPDAVRITRLRIERILLNLCLNARDAMGGEGTITIAARGRSDGRLEVAVSDTGPGVPEGAMRRLADPDDDLRDARASHGLGLRTSRQLATEAGGALEVESIPGVGSVFRLVLPRA
jgi:signal transduction histidine kinase